MVGAVPASIRASRAGPVIIRGPGSHRLARFLVRASQPAQRFSDIRCRLHGKRDPARAGPRRDRAALRTPGAPLSGRLTAFLRSTGTPWRRSFRQLDEERERRLGRTRSRQRGEDLPRAVEREHAEHGTAGDVGPLGDLALELRTPPQHLRVCLRQPRSLRHVALAADIAGTGTEARRTCSSPRLRATHVRSPALRGGGSHDSATNSQRSRSREQAKGTWDDGSSPCLPGHDEHPALCGGRDHVGLSPWDRDVRRSGATPSLRHGRRRALTG